jgi:hypothetical protein
MAFVPRRSLWHWMLIGALLIVVLPTASSAAPHPTYLASGGTIWHVPGDFSSIQSAINAASSGDTVLVAAGSYTGSLNFNGKALTVQSSAGSAATAIVGNGGAAVTIGPLGALIGFSVSHGVGYDGGGIAVSGAGTIIRSNILIDNAALVGGTGAAIAGNGASPLIDGNIFRNNTCDTQFLSGVVSFIGTSSPQIMNNLFINNPCRAINVTLPEGPTPQIYNNTIVGNPVGIRVDARVPAVAQIYRNNILVGNTVGLVVDFSVAAAYDPTWEYNLVFDNTVNYQGIADQTGLQHNLSADPLFVDPTQAQYSLQTTSPAVDSGTNVQCPAADLRNSPRPQGSRCDIGAYEVIEAQVGFLAQSTAVPEHVGAANITVTLDQVLPVTATVAYSTTTIVLGVRATPGIDYQPSAGMLTFPPGSTHAQFAIQILDDRVPEPDEALLLMLSNASAPNTVLRVAAPATLTITDTDVALYLALVR